MAQNSGAIVSEHIGENIGEEQEMITTGTYSQGSLTEEASNDSEINNNIYDQYIISGHEIEKEEKEKKEGVANTLIDEQPISGTTYLTPKIHMHLTGTTTTLLSGNTISGDIQIGSKTNDIMNDAHKKSTGYTSFTLYDSNEGELLLPDQGTTGQSIDETIELTIYDTNDGEEVAIQTSPADTRQIYITDTLTLSSQLIILDQQEQEVIIDEKEQSIVSSIHRKKGSRALFKGGTRIQSMHKKHIQQEDLTIQKITTPVAGFSERTIAGAVKLGPQDDHLIFSHPVTITMEVDAQYEGKILEVYVQHLGDIGYSMESISTDPTTRCDSLGNSTLPDNKVRVKNQQVQFTTCGASTFILDPDGDSTEELTLWLKADAGTSCTSSGCSLSSRSEQSGNPVFSTNAPSQATPANQPTLATNSLNFNPIIQFASAATQSLNTASNISTNSLIGPNRDTGSYYTVSSTTNAAIWQHGDRMNMTNASGRLGRNTDIAFGATVTTPAQLIHFNRNGGTYTTYIDGLLTNTVTNTNVQNSQNRIFSVGVVNGIYMNGSMAETMIYNESHGPTERQGIMSYLALKYGITLDNSIGSYINSNGSTVYTIDATYNNDIAGIARDDAFTLDQRIARSHNTSSFITVATDSDISSPNGGTRTSLSDNQYLIRGHDNGNPTSTQTNNIDTDVYTGRISRTWKVHNTNNVSNITVNFDSLPSLGTGELYALIVDTDSDFTTGYTELLLSSDPLFEGVNFLGGIQYMTVAITIANNDPYLEVQTNDNDTDNLVFSGDIVRYTINITNNGLSTGTAIGLTETIDTNYSIPYNVYASGSCTPNIITTSPNLILTGINIGVGETCSISYDVQVESTVSGGDTLQNSTNVSSASEGGNDPGDITSETLTVIDCGFNDITITFTTDNRGEDTYWSLVPTGDACGSVNEIANGGNTIDLTCADGGNPPQANNANGYPDNATITEGPFNLPVGNTYDLHIIDDRNDGITTIDPDVTITQNSTITHSGAVVSPSSIVNFTVIAPTVCIDTTAPNVTINQAIHQNDPTITNNAIYTIAFDEPINTTTFTSGDIILTGSTTALISSGPYQVSPNNSTIFEIIVNNMTAGDTIEATIPGGTIEDLAGNSNTPSSSTDNSITYNPNFSGGNINIIAPPLFVYSGGFQSESYTQTGSQQFSGYFIVDDTLGADNGWYTTIQMSNFSGINFGDNLANNILAWYATGVELLSGDSNPDVLLATGRSNYRTADSIYTFILRNPGPNSNRIGSYGVAPRFEFTIPPYIRADTYEATITYTLYE